MPDQESQAQHQRPGQALSAPPGSGWAGFWWERYPITMERREWTPLRVKAAERAVQREADNMPLFPELRRVHTVAQRMEQMDKRADLASQKLRNHRAKTWREARQFVRSLSPQDRERLKVKWNTRFTPGGPADLFAVARLIGLDTPNPFLSQNTEE
jgi:hypothetical protein